MIDKRYRTRINKGVVAVQTSGENSPPDCFIEMGSSPISIFKQKRNHTQRCGFFLVDDIGLEPMTFRTSSGCSSQLS